MRRGRRGERGEKLKAEIGKRKLESGKVEAETLEGRRKGPAGGGNGRRKGRSLRCGAFATLWRASRETRGPSGASLEIVGKIERCDADYLRFATVHGPSGASLETRGPFGGCWVG